MHLPALTAEICTTLASGNGKGSEWNVQIGVFVFDGDDGRYFGPCAENGWETSSMIAHVAVWCVPYLCLVDLF